MTQLHRDQRIQPMTHGTDIFILSSDEDAALRMLDKCPEASIETKSKYSWMKLRYSGYEASETLLAEMFRNVEVIWLSISSPTDYFYYLHWNNGIVQREMRHEEGYWAIVKGNPEPWEHPAFFPEDVLMQYPSYSRFHRAEAEGKAHKEATTIEPGSHLWICSKDAWNAVVSHYGLIE